MRATGPTLALLLAAAGGCRSSAPYTLPSAILNSALAVGVAAQQRAEGGCYSTCAGGFACNPRTGYCEPVSLCGTCKSGETCTQSETGWRCTPVGGPAIDVRSGAAPAPPLPVVPGIAPSTGKPPPTPAEQKAERP